MKGRIHIFKGFSNAAKIGLAMEGIAGIIMLLAVLFEKPVPDVAVWIFTIGLALVLISSLRTAILEKKNHTNPNL